MLIILPCAGGCAANFTRYNSFLNDVHTYEYPGHWTRFSEPLRSDPKYLIRDLLDCIISGRYGNRIDLFGHSMGGLLAWLLACELLNRGIEINHLYLVACGIPQIRPKFLYEIENDDDIKGVLARIRQIPENILESDFFNRNLLPVIRNDFEVVRILLDNLNSYTDAQIPSDITCFYGNEDPVIDYLDMCGWREYTKRGFDIQEFKGDHFFLYKTDSIKAISELIEENRS